MRDFFEIVFERINLHFTVYRSRWLYSYLKKSMFFRRVDIWGAYGEQMSCDRRTAVHTDVDLGKCTLNQAGFYWV